MSASRVSNSRPRGLERYPSLNQPSAGQVFNLPLTAYSRYTSAITNTNRATETLITGHGAVTGATHPRGRLTGLAQHAGETAVAPLVVHRPQVRAGLIEAVRPTCGRDHRAQELRRESVCYRRVLELRP